MAILEAEPGFGPREILATIEDLAIGFAVLAKQSGAKGDHARDLHRITFRLAKRFNQFGKDGVSAHLESASQLLALRRGL